MEIISEIEKRIFLVKYQGGEYVLKTNLKDEEMSYYNSKFQKYMFIRKLLNFHLIIWEVQL